ncbi:oxoeicosanoid receptor 1 [Pteronotus mesoamericanus]|uniref:oxoeicosanoid receptor 1 n=1 Tax=Pteronotus mesoamericanus TaxID=1884717 RepID=UPI0023EC8A5B|nr:oxoeicosanoid receptor 1 [Pteronotus parnellii mesoamericanus]
MQHMEFHNRSASSLLPALSPSTLPSSLTPSPFPPSAFPTALGSPAPCLPAYSPKLSAFLVPVLGVEFVLGLVGNSLAFFIFCAYTRPWSPNVVFLVSLVIADFLLIANLPLRVDYYRRHETWHFGDVACKVNLFMLSTNRTASVVFLTAIALNRYLKVVWPHHALSRASVRAASWVAGGLWGSILLLNGHVFLITYPTQSCLSYQLGMHSSATIQWHNALYLLEFFLPLALILFAVVSIVLTIRRRGLGGQAGPRRAERVLAAVVAVYTICFLPSIVFGVASLVAFHLRACPTLDICSLLFHSSLAFTYLNSVLDPVLYCFSSPNFLCHCRALLGLNQGSQGPDSDENSYQPPGCIQKASRKVQTIGKLQAEGSLDVSLD